MQRHLHRVSHIEKIALLLPVLELRPVALEKAYFSHGQDLFVGLVHERAHIALVALVRAEDVEVLQTHDAIQIAFLLGVQIEPLLGPPVEVERIQPGEVLVLVVHAGGAVAIGGGGGGVDEARSLRKGPFGELPGVTKIVVLEVGLVALSGRGTGAKMKDCAEPSEGPGVGLDPGAKNIGFDVVREFQRGQVAALALAAGIKGHHAVPSLGGLKEISDKDVGPAALVERPHKRAADEAGAAGDQNATFVQSKFRSWGGIHSLTLAVTRSGSLNCGFQVQSGHARSRVAVPL